VKGKRHTKDHNGKISESLKSFHAKKRRIRIFIEADVHEFDSFAEAAEYLECSRQLVSQVLRPNQPNRKAKGYRIEFVEG